MHGLCRHDEIMVINGALVQELDMMFVESILQEELTLCLMIRYHCPLRRLKSVLLKFHFLQIVSNRCPTTRASDFKIGKRSGFRFRHHFHGRQ